MKRFKFYTIIFCVLLPFLISAQKDNSNLDSIQFQEITYAHLNKSIYLRGEALGFTSYIFKKGKKELSKKTKNLYCKIVNDRDSVIKQKLILVENGIASGSFDIDNSFKEGNFKFIAFTNWMRNFNEENIFSTSFEVINPESVKEISKESRSKELDIQLMPESGNLIHNAFNTVGVVIKDKFGFGVPNIKGVLYNGQNKPITDFKLNKLGIGRFSFLPNRFNNYYVKLFYGGESVTQSLDHRIHLKGILLNVKQNKNKCIISIITNKESLSELKKNPLKLAFFNKGNYKSLDIVFDENLIIKKINLEDLDIGMNVFTLFDSSNRPIAERLFFNYRGLKLLTSNIKSVTLKDTVTSIKLNYKLGKPNIFNNVSISILPTATKSYNHHNTIISQSLLKPYIRGLIENSGYYFKNISKKTKYDLDNLLITQGWSSYDWSSMFNEKTANHHQFEDGISIKVNIPKNEKSRAFMVSSPSEEEPSFVNVDDNVESFSITKYTPKEDEILFISSINKKDKLNKPSLYIQFMPNRIPDLDVSINALAPKKKYYGFETYNKVADFSSLNKREVLDEVVIKANLEKIRREKIRGKSFGRVYFLDDTDRTLSLARYLNEIPGIRAFDDYRSGTIVARSRDGRLALVVDGTIVTEDQLYGSFLDDVEYIDINRVNPIRYITTHPGGEVNIKTNRKKFMSRKKTVLKNKFPLTFSENKKFYVPKYESYTSTFYKNYGTINWLSTNTIDENGSLNISFTNNFKEDFTLFIEGFTSNGEYILEEKMITKN